MLIYHPASDVHHCCYRLLNILRSMDNLSIDLHMLHLIDFYYVYPHLLKKISPLPRPLNSRSKNIKHIKEPFEVNPHPQNLFYELNQIQDSAITSLLQKNLISILRDNAILCIENVPLDLINRFSEDSFSKSETFETLINFMSKTNLEGKSGLKSRTGLMEFRYD